MRAERPTVAVAGPSVELMGAGAPRAHLHPDQVDAVHKGDGFDDPEPRTADTLLPIAPGWAEPSGEADARGMTGWADEGLPLLWARRQGRR